MCILLGQDLPWGSYNVSERSGKKIPVGPACYYCGTAGAVAYPSMSFSDVVSKAKANEQFKQQLSAAREHLIKNPPPQQAWVPETVSEETSSLLLLKRSYLFLTCDEFEAMNECKIPSDVTLHELTDEAGRVTKGLLLKDPQNPHRRVELQRVVALQLERGIASSSQMLRPQQNKDLFKMLVADDVSKNRKGFTNPLDEKEVEELVKRAQAAASAVSREVPAEELAPLQSPEKKRKTGSDGGDDEMLSPMRQVSAIPTQAWRDEAKLKAKNASSGRGGRGKRSWT